MKKKPDVTAPDHFPVVIISDLHIGMKFGAGDMLCEFLQHTTCERLILNGDIIDGRIINHRRPKELPESQKRVLDAINRKIAEGTEVIYIPGNHDIEVRKLGLAGQKICGVRIEQTLDLADAKGRKLFVLHGDQFDRREKKVEHLPQWFMRGVGRANDALNTLSTAFDKVAKAVFRKRLNLARKVRGWVEGDKRGHHDQEQSALAHAKEHGYGGIVCGHSHTPAKKETDGVLYLNSGDWVDSFSALTMSADGEWNVLKWPERRKELGLKRKFLHVANDNPDKEFRPQTEKMIDAIRSIWPGRGGKRHGPKKPNP